METIAHEHSGHRGAFVWMRDGKRLAEMTYTVAGTRVIIDHTDVDEALRELEKLDPRQSQIVELRFFGGLTIAEISSALNISVATVHREWALAKVWLHRELSRAD